MSGCTCGPHPIVDLTAAYLEYHKIRSHSSSSEDDELLTSVHQQIRKACRSHGCFHVTIQLTNEEDSSPHPHPPIIQCLAKPLAEVEHEIESLFSPSFLQTANANLNGGLVKVRIKDLSSSSSRFIEEATFRGRTAESGDEQQPKPEPKLSWEFRRCLSARTAAAESMENNDRDHFSLPKNEAWNFLSNWTESLHSVASVVIHSMGITKQVVLNEKSCNCLHKIMSNPNNDATSSLEKCTVDLLRCFRYDAIPIEEKYDQLGSSSHTDWGSLTVVWQDDVGGLQTYCHACEKWTAVATPGEQYNTTTTSSNNNTINLFVHVGDFLSLATHGEGMTHLPIWPSPRHRVVCPTKQPDQSESSQCRRSLVYFAYPPPNISLAAAQKVVEPLICDDTYESSVMFHPYSLLHDQSQQANQLDGVDSTNFETYQDMRLRPFGEVISEKWDQVQRN